MAPREALWLARRRVQALARDNPQVPRRRQSPLQTVRLAMLGQQVLRKRDMPTHRETIDGSGCMVQSFETSAQLANSSQCTGKRTRLVYFYARPAER
jgi:hypothetical protein